MWRKGKEYNVYRCMHHQYTLTNHLKWTISRREKRFFSKYVGIEDRSISILKPYVFESELNICWNSRQILQDIRREYLFFKFLFRWWSLYYSIVFFVNLRFNDFLVDFEQLFKEFWSNRMKRNAFKWKYSMRKNDERFSKMSDTDWVWVWLSVGGCRFACQ